MRIEFFPNGSHDCPAILFHGCPSPGAEALIRSFKSLAGGREIEVALHQLPGVTPAGGIQVFASIGESDSGVQRLSALAFRWRKDREGWLEASELAGPVAHCEPHEGTKFQYLERNGEINIVFSTNRVW